MKLDISLKTSHRTFSPFQVTTTQLTAYPHSSHYILLMKGRHGRKIFEEDLPAAAGLM